MSISLELQGISKSYQKLTVLNELSAVFAGPGIYCITAPSGAGKTTFFRLVMGLETPDQGRILLTPDTTRISAVFQEDRLIEHLSPMENVCLVLDRPDPETVKRELLCLLPEECLSRPVCTLSGGMKRRCALVRALLSPARLVVLDEPFTGLDEKTKDVVTAYVRKHSENRLFLIATHSREDIKKLEAVEVTFSGLQSVSGQNP